MRRSAVNSPSTRRPASSGPSGNPRPAPAREDPEPSESQNDASPCPAIRESAPASHLAREVEVARGASMSAERDSARRTAERRVHAQRRLGDLDRSPRQACHEFEGARRAPASSRGLHAADVSEPSTGSANRRAPRSGQDQAADMESRRGGSRRGGREPARRARSQSLGRVEPRSAIRSGTISASSSRPRRSGRTRSSPRSCPPSARDAPSAVESSTSSNFTRGTGRKAKVLRPPDLEGRARRPPAAAARPPHGHAAGRDGPGGDGDGRRAQGSKSETSRTARRDMAAGSFCSVPASRSVDGRTVPDGECRRPRRSFRRHSHGGLSKLRPPCQRTGRWL